MIRPPDLPATERHEPSPLRPEAIPLEHPHYTIAREPAAPGSLRAGLTVGDYELLEELARGGMGVVFKARQRSLNRVVAVKLILAGELAGADAVRRFRAEAEAAAGLDHPNILPIHEVGERDGQPYFSMKLVEGGDLHSQVPRLLKDPHAAVDLMIRVADAVEYAHRHGVLHRDLKPSNILIDANGTPYVADFGLAKRSDGADTLTRTGVILGTPGYMAPEQARAEKHLSPAADVYALGAILFHLLTGRPPFQGPTSLDTLLETLESEPPHPRGVRPMADPGLSLVALKCLAKDPGDRYASAADLGEDLRRWSVGEPISARPPRPHQRLLGWARREPGLACRLAVFALCAIVVMVAETLGPAPDRTKAPKIIAMLAGWAIVSMACQWFLRRDRYALWASTAWLAADMAFLTGLLIFDQSEETPLVFMYGPAVAASGMWFRVRLVWFATIAAVTGYVAMIGHVWAQGRSTELLPHHVILVLGLVTIGAVVAYQVRRARMLGQRFGSRSSA